MLSGSEENQILDEFCKLVDDTNQKQETLIRFLRARNHDLAAAEDMLRKFLEWRALNDMDNALEWEVPEHVTQALPIELPGNDYENRIVAYVPFGKWTIRELIDEGYLDEVIRRIYKLIEWGMGEVEKTGNKFMLIFDLEGLSYWTVTHYQTIQTTLKVFRDYEAYLPETLGHVLIINAPAIFSWVWPMLKGVFTGTTLSKIEVLSGSEDEYMPIILEQIPFSSLPKELGQKYQKFEGRKQSFPSSFSFL